MALYHTYRPQKFADVTGQEHIIQTLTNQLKKNKAAHAYLFSGPRGVGKTTSARLLAKALNCTERKEGETEPCNACSSCEQISRAKSIDVIEIDAASHTGVDNVREHIIENAQFQPTSSSHKIFIIDEVHMLSTSAFNALLKTLEEPPSYVVFILATTELHKLPETIISRCQVYNFKKISFDALKQYLESIAKNESVDVDNDVIERIINKSDGCARDAVSLLDQLMASGEKTITADVASLVLPTSNIDSVLSFVRALFDKDAKEMLALVDAAREDGVHIDQLMHDIIEIVRTIMIQKVNPNAIGSMDINETAKKELSRMGKTLNMNELIGLIDLLIQRKKEIKTAPLPHLPLEMVVIVWCAGTPIKSNMDQEPPPSSTPDAPQQQTEPPPTKTTPAKTQEQEHAPPQKETIKQKVKNIVSKTSEVTIEDVRNIWEDYIHRLEELYPSFVFILRMASIIKVEHNTVELGVAYSFHKDKLMDTVCKKNLETVLSEILNSSVSLAATVQKEEEHAEPRKEDTELQELASAFGGKIVQ